MNGSRKLVVLLALIGVAGWLRWSGRNAVGALLIVTMLYFTLVPALTQWDQDRFRLPVDALFLAFAVWGLRTLARPGAASATPIDSRAS